LGETNTAKSEGEWLPSQYTYLYILFVYNYTTFYVFCPQKKMVIIEIMTERNRAASSPGNDYTASIAVYVNYHAAILSSLAPNVLPQELYSHLYMPLPFGVSVMFVDLQYGQ
jgi:hypothetical protein